MVVVPIKKRSENQETPTPGPTPSPTPNPIPKLSIVYEFNELNRAVELINFFENTIVPFLKKRKVDDKLIASISTVFASKVSELVLRKYQLTVSTINLEKAIEIIDEALPKLLKESSPTIDVDMVIKTWETLKKIITGGSK
ncbi:hypothetical protein [Saccharolobus caldissimus]|uniref:Uncharacterized protein n=1 Tax=Saccharolobus caldissimus TaxID=1702097 RepID=A0AAQ4CQ46_9CREN|nr:hypothetical protein [Saccharolobus caldissimus]BDB97927.1 hypothetical protein SACC_09440 [Saccharolobus caldissimus]